MIMTSTHIRWCVLALVGLVVMSLLPVGFSSGGGKMVISHASRLAGSGALSNAYGKLPLVFEANEGQADGGVRFLSRGRGYTLFLTASDPVLAFGDKGSQSVL